MKEVELMSKDKKVSGVKGIVEELGVPAGCFSSWLRRTRCGLVKEKGVNVDCGDCNACCRSSYFIHIRPEEKQTLARINRKLLFPAPGLPKGNVLLGYYSNGHCPMMIEGQCSIYEERPITCRSYDCRIFTAAGIDAGVDDKAGINLRIKQWKFSYPTILDLRQHSAVQAAAKFLIQNAESFPAGVVPKNASQVALLAIKVYGVFLEYIDETGEEGLISSNNEVINKIIESIERFEARRL